MLSVSIKPTTWTHYYHLTVLIRHFVTLGENTSAPYISEDKYVNRRVLSTTAHWNCKSRKTMFSTFIYIHIRYAYIQLVHFTFHCSRVYARVFYWEAAHDNVIISIIYHYRIDIVFSSSRLLRILYLQIVKYIHNVFKTYTYMLARRRRPQRTYVCIICAAVITCGKPAASSEPSAKLRSNNVSSLKSTRENDCVECVHLYLVLSNDVYFMRKRFRSCLLQHIIILHEPEIAHNICTHFI